MLTKKVTVLMPVYNGAKYLSEAIESILTQTYKDFDLLIINDGSTDNSEEIIKSFDDSRIKYVSNENNIGLIKTLNKGLNLAQSEYIARMDADDISLPNRLERQIQYMDKHNEIAVSGTSILLFNDKGEIRKDIVRHDPREIKTQLLFNCALMHPTVIIRKKIIDQGHFAYNEEHQTVEDFGLWHKMSLENKLGNIQEILLKYRMNESGITQMAEKDINRRDAMHIKVYQQSFDSLGMKVTEEDLLRYRHFLTGRVFSDSKNINALSKLIRRLKIHIENNRDFDIETFNRKIGGYFRKNCINGGLSFFETTSIYKEHFKNTFKYSLEEKMKFVIRRYFKY